MPTALGIFFVLAALIAEIRRPRVGPLYVLAASAGFMGSAAVQIGSNSVPPFYVLGALVAARQAANLIGTKSASKYQTEIAPYVSSQELLTRLRSLHGLLWLFFGWCLLVTLIAPTVFRGIRVLDPRGGTDAEIAFPTPLNYGASNVNQLLYLLVGILIVLEVSRSTVRVDELLLPAFLFPLVLSALRYVLPDRFEDLYSRWIDNSSNVRYINFTPTGDERFRGVFSEPSILATFSISAVAFLLCLAFHRSGSKRILVLVGAALALANLWLSAAGTAVAGGLLVVLVALSLLLYRTITMQPRLSSAVGGGLLAGAVILLLFGAPVVQAVGQIVAGKLGSASYVNRTAADRFSIELAEDTFWLGTGLGSNRPSTFWPMLASTVGVIGIMIFVVLVWKLLRSGWSSGSSRATAWAVLSFLLVKSIAGPNLAEPVLWLSVGVLGNVYLRTSVTSSAASGEALPRGALQ